MEPGPTPSLWSIEIHFCQAQLHLAIAVAIELNYYHLTRLAVRQPAGNETWIVSKQLQIGPSFIYKINRIEIPLF